MTQGKAKPTGQLSVKHFRDGVELNPSVKVKHFRRVQNMLRKIYMLGRTGIVNEGQNET